MMKLIFLTYLIQLSKADQQYDFLMHRLPVVGEGNDAADMKYPRHDMYDRITLLSRQIYEDANRRILEINDIRYMYEETKEYESGYIMGEIIERYRKLMEEGRMAYANLHSKYKALKHSAAGLLNRVEKAQQLYFEEYHLVRMMQEIAAKYEKTSGGLATKKRSRLRMLSPKKQYNHDLQAKLQKQKAEQREKERREKMENYRDQILEKMHDREYLNNKKKYSYYNYSLVHQYTKKPYRDSKGLPFDYGWEIGYLN